MKQHQGTAHNSRMTRSSSIVVRSGDGITIEVAAEDGNVHLTVAGQEATLDPHAVDDLVHALLEALAEGGR